MPQQYFILEGFVGKDPEFNDFLRSQKALLSVATHYQEKNTEGGLERKTRWYQVVTWDEIACYVQQSLVKGSRVRVEGELRRYFYTDLNGCPRSYRQLVAKRLFRLPYPTP